MKRTALVLASGLALASAGVGCVNGETIPGMAGRRSNVGPGEPGNPSTPGGNPFDPGNPGGNNPGGNNPGGNNPGGNNPGGATPSAQVACPNTAGDTPGKRVLRRLTGPEYEATVRAAFGLGAQMPALSLPPDPASLDGFTNNIDRLNVSPDYAKGALESAQKVAALVTSDAVLNRLLPCAAAGGPPCAQTFITTFGPKLFRRPLTAEEQVRYMDFAEKVSRQADFKSGIYWVVQTMLQSPHVIYRSELGTPAGERFALTPYELASALAYTFTGGPPTPELMQLAQSNRLSTADQLEAAARSLVYDAAGKVKPTFRDVMLQFADQWVGLSTLSNLKKDDQAFPDFNDQIQDALSEETRRFLSAVLIDEKGSPTALFNAPFTFVDSRLSKYYGFGGAAGAEFVKVPRPAGWGSGLLSQGSVLAVESHSLSTSPTKRGYFVRTRVLCHEVPPPPPVVSELPEPTASNTTRERYEKLHVAEESCKACHQMIDQIGFGFEKLDASGRYRAREGAFDIDDSGVVTGTSAGDIRFQGAADLAAKLAPLPEVASCMASYLSAYAFGVNQPNASCLVRSATNELRAGTLTVVDFYIKMVRSEHFRARI